MPSAWIDLISGSIQLVSQHLEVKGMVQDEEGNQQNVQRQIPLFDLERLAVAESITITGPALAALMRAEIPLVIIGRGQPQILGSVLPASPAHAQWRVTQYESCRDVSISLPLAQSIIAAKIFNQRRTLQRLSLSREEDVSVTLRLLSDAQLATGRCRSIAELLGIEGNASAQWYQCWARFLPAEHPFERRSRRPPHNRVNAVLSFTSALLYHEMNATLHACGLDAGLGILHVTENGRWSLALDLMEPFRPLIIEPLALDVFSRGILREEHFHAHQGGIYLNAAGRKKLILQYEKRMEREFLSEHRGHRTTLRGQIQHDAADYKSQLERPLAYSPFRMN